MSKEFQDLCPGCFEVKGRQPVCGRCGYDESARRGPLVLPHRTVLRNQYLIGRVLGKPGGFGITYLAFDTGLETRVAIKEYLPRDLAGRESGELSISAHSDEDGELFRFGLEQFLREACTLAKFDHAHLVGVHSVFEENGTAYLVMDYYEGMTLAEYLDRQGGKVSEKTAIDIMMPIMDGLREVHEKGFIHRDIKPQNIYLTTQGRAILLDFGAARLAMAERSKSLSVVLTPGYAPFEQYRRRGEQGPWTDVYACAAVLYRMVTGKTPPEATDRMDMDSLAAPKSFYPALSSRANQAILRGLVMDFRQRPQTIASFQDSLPDKSIAPPEPQNSQPRNEVPDPSPDFRLGHGIAWPLIFIWVAILVGAGISNFESRQRADAERRNEEVRRGMEAEQRAKQIKQEEESEKQYEAAKRTDEEAEARRHHIEEAKQQAAAAKRALNLPIRAQITYPTPWAEVERVAEIQGTLNSFIGYQKIFLIVRSTAAEFGRLYYPQGEVTSSSEWTMKAVFGSANYVYEVFVVATDNQDSATLLGNPRSRNFGLKDLPKGVHLISDITNVKRAK